VLQKIAPQGSQYRAKKFTAEQRRAIAKEAAEARRGKKH
jgi:hypothetical protein